MSTKKTSFMTRTLALVLAVMAVLTAIPFSPVVANAASNYDGGYAIAIFARDVYSDSSLTTYKGRIYENEPFTVLNKISSNVYHVEYSTSGGAKEGYIRVDNDTYSILDYTSTSCVATMNADTNVYYGNDSSKYLRAGSVDAGERVVVVSKLGSWAYIEYNTTNGRKRGFVLSSSLTCYNEPVVYGDFFIDDAGSPDRVSNSYTVYAGPGYQYASVGSVSNEDVILHGSVIGNENDGAYFIEYSVAGSSQKKCGFIFI